MPVTCDLVTGAGQVDEEGAESALLWTSSTGTGPCAGRSSSAQGHSLLLLTQQIQKMKPGSTTVITQVSQQNIDTIFQNTLVKPGKATEPAPLTSTLPVLVLLAEELAPLHRLPRPH